MSQTPQPDADSFEERWRQQEGVRTKSRNPLHDAGAERDVLGSVLLKAELFDEVADVIGPDDFFAPAHTEIWNAIQALRQRGAAVDVTAVTGELKRRKRLEAAGGADVLNDMTDVLPTVTNAVKHAETIRDLAAIRATVAASQRIQAAAHEPIEDAAVFLDDAQRQMLEASERRGEQRACVPLGDVGAEALDQAIAAHERGQVLTGTSTGLERLDKLTTGMHPGELFIAAGRPGMGKSAFAQALALAVGEQGLPVAVLSLEMPKKQWAQRAHSSLSNVPFERIRTARFRDGDIAALRHAQEQLQRLPIAVDDEENITIYALRSKVRRVRRQHGALGLVVVDYLQLMRSAGRSRDPREQQVAEISRSLKALAKELDVPVLALAQLNRGPESRSDKRPSLGDLRESGALEQDADAVLLLYRDEVYDPETEDSGIAEIIIGKQRNGPTGIVKCSYVGDCVRFENLHAPRPGASKAAPHWNEVPSRMEDEL